MAHIKLKGVDFSYPVIQLSDRSLKIAIMRNIVGSRIVSRANKVEVQALVGIDLDLKEGDRLGVIGRNGSGKSTLLRLLAGLLRPDSGEFEVEGRIVSTMTRGLGMTPERTGRQNIELPLRLLGATDEEVREAHAFVPEWTGLGPYFDFPMRTYSDGMRARVSFAISTSVRGDILILDEWMNAGDVDFVAKARQRATHDLKIADNTYETVEASFQLRNLMRDSSSSFEAIQKLEAPTFDQIFKNEELRREFENLTRKLDGPTS